MKMKVSAYRAWCHFMAKMRRNYVQNEKILCPTVYAGHSISDCERLHTFIAKFWFCKRGLDKRKAASL